MDSLLKEFFGSDEPEPAATASAAAPADDANRAAEREAREARRTARDARRADKEHTARRQEFSDRYSTGHPSEGFTAEEAISHLQELKDELSPAEFRKAMEQTLNNLPVDQRDDFLAIMKQHKAQAAGAAEAAGAAGAATKAASSADPFGGLLTGLLGGGAAAGASGAPDIGAVINDLRTGGLNAPAPAGGGQPTEADFMALINSPLGKAVLGGLAAYSMQALQNKDDKKQ